MWQTFVWALTIVFFYLISQSIDEQGWTSCQKSGFDVLENETRRSKRQNTVVDLGVLRICSLVYSGRYYAQYLAGVS